MLIKGIAAYGSHGCLTARHFRVLASILLALLLLRAFFSSGFQHDPKYYAWNSSAFHQWHSSITSTFPLTEKLNAEPRFHYAHSTHPTADTIPRNVFRCSKTIIHKGSPARLPSTPTYPSSAHSTGPSSSRLLCPPRPRGCLHKAAAWTRHSLNIRKEGQDATQAHHTGEETGKKKKVSIDHTAYILWGIFKPQRRNL